MALVTIRHDDPRTRVGAYVHDSAKRNLFEVIDNERGVLVLDNCKTNFKLTIGRAQIAGYTLVKPAPELPAFVEDQSEIHEHMSPVESD